MTTRRAFRIYELDAKGLAKFYHEERNKRGFKLGTREAHDLWWAMFYAWRDKREWLME